VRQPTLQSRDTYLPSASAIMPVLQTNQFLSGQNMDEQRWRALWIETLLKGGVDMESALDAFDIFYGDEGFDTEPDPVATAQQFLDDAKS